MKVVRHADVQKPASSLVHLFKADIRFSMLTGSHFSATFEAEAPSFTGVHPSGTSRDITKLPQKAHHPRFRRIALHLKLDQLFHFGCDIDHLVLFAQVHIAADIEVEIIRLDLACRHHPRQPLVSAKSP